MPIERKCLKVKARQRIYMVDHFQLEAACPRVLDAEYMGHCYRKVRYCCWWKRQRTHTHAKCDKSKGRGARRYQLLKASVKAGEQIFKKIIQFFCFFTRALLAHMLITHPCAAVTLPRSGKNGQTWNLRFCLSPSHSGICPWGVNASKVAAGL